jgi:hypothetical protein
MNIILPLKNEFSIGLKKGEYIGIVSLNIQYWKKVMSQIGFAPLFRDFGIQRKSKISNCATRIEDL